MPMKPIEKKMTVLFNATTLVKGGALQVATAFIRQSLKDCGGVDWHFALSKEVIRELAEDELAQLNGRFTVFEISPSRSKAARKKLSDLHGFLDSDVVFTLFGPAYVEFKGPHICGVADGWVTHSNLLAIYALGSVRSAVRMILTIMYKAFWFRKVNVWVVEANNAKQGLINRLKINPESIHVVSNTCSQFYRNKQIEGRIFKKGEKIRLICLSAYYRSKNLEIIPEVARYILDMDAQFDFEFVITLPTDDSGLGGVIEKAKSLGVEDYIYNIGPVRVSEGVDVYEKCHIAFVPSLLETFSANYPEAMAMKKPIVTTDLAFAHDACKDAALYYQPTNAKSAAEEIIKLTSDPIIWKQLVNCGSRVLAGLPTPEERFNKYIDIIKSCSTGK